VLLNPPRLVLGSHGDPEKTLGRVFEDSESQTGLARASLVCCIVFRFNSLSRTHARMHTRVHTYTHMRTHTRTHTHTHAYTRARAHTYTHTHTHTIHTHTHAHTHKLAARMHLSASDANRLLPDRSQTLMQLRVMAAGVRLWAEDNFRRDPTWSFDPRRISQSKLEHLFGYIRGLAGPNNLTETSYRKALVAFIVIFMDKHFGDAPVNGANHLAEAHDGEARREIDELLFQAGHL
jgi:hypothetical protein